jgi:hypothetical protein
MRSRPRVWAAAGIIALSTVGLVTATSASGASRSATRPGAAAARQPRAIDVYVTYYGWYDNTPPGCATSYSGCAGGKGTYQHPITFASYTHEFPVGTILYYPTIEKYVRMGDSCQECQEDWTGKGPDGGPRLHHLDIWIGGKGGNEFDVINCEDGLTQALPNGKPLLTPFIVNPPSGLPVSTEQLFNSRTNHCFGGATTSATHGRYKNVKSGKCLAEPGSRPKAGSPAELAACNTSANEKISFEGAFLVDRKLCVQTTSGKAGAAITFATCNGNARQQWSINPNGTITWIQFTMCIADISGKVKLAKCTNPAADRWVFTAERP